MTSEIEEIFTIYYETSRTVTAANISVAMSAIYDSDARATVYGVLQKLKYIVNDDFSNFFGEELLYDNR
ncbi:hypothetical protein AGMMS49975_08410 [Clostridia bacterium]|nr:hypothetical protein AGMMS49975_08410 [Clostridia bacterium]